MAQLIMEFGASSFEAAAAATRAILEGVAFEALVLPPGKLANLDYEVSTQRSLNELLREVRNGTSVALSLYSPSYRIFDWWLTVYRPLGVEPNRSSWYGVIEYKGFHFADAYRALQQLDDVFYISVCEDEGLDLDDGYLTTEAFPWDNQGLLVASIRRHDDKSWVTRKGSARSAGSVPRSILAG